MKQTKNDIRHMGYTVLVKSKEGTFETVGVGLPSKDQAHELVNRDYKGEVYRIEGRRMNYTPDVYVKREPKSEKKEEV